MMKRVLSVLVIVATVAIAAVSDQAAKPKFDLAQVPKWSPDDLAFFLHGSMSTEIVRRGRGNRE